MTDSSGRNALRAETEAAEGFLGLMRRRYACKKFRRGESLGRDAFGFLLECGRLSPSSFGLEPWKFVAVDSEPMIRRLAEACGMQEPVCSCAGAVVILSRAADSFDPSGDFVSKRAGRFPGGIALFDPDYRPYHDFLETAGRTREWSRAQTYIAAANMMTGAAAIGLDSCPIEGFDEKALLEALEEDAARWIAGLVIAFGRSEAGLEGRGNETRRTRIREPIETLVRWV